MSVARSCHLNLFETEKAGEADKEWETSSGAGENCYHRVLKSALAAMGQQEEFCWNPKFNRGPGSSTRTSQYAGLVVTTIRVSVLFQFGCLSSVFNFFSERQFPSKHFSLQL